MAAVRGRLDLESLAADDDLALPAIALAEYAAGVLPVHDYDRSVAEHHAALLAHVRQTARPRGAHDLVVAATARANSRVVATTEERARFGDLPGVAVRLLAVG